MKLNRVRLLVVLVLFLGSDAARPEESLAGDKANANPSSENVSRHPDEHSISDLHLYSRLVVELSRTDQVNRWILQHSIRDLGTAKSTLRLVSMMHFAENSFYSAIERELETCDLILYEGPSFKESREQTGYSDEMKQLRLMGELQAKLTGLTKQGDWQQKFEDDPRWILADLSRKEMLDYLRQHKTPLVNDRMKRKIKEVKKLVETNQVDHLMAKDFKKEIIQSRLRITRQNCCFHYLSEEERQVVHKFVHDMRNENLIKKISDVVSKNPKAKIAVVYGAMHLFEIEPILRSQLGFDFKSAVWLDVASAQD